MEAIFGVVPMAIGATVRAGLGIAVGLAVFHELRGNQPGWDSNNAVSQNHDNGRNELSQRRNGSNVAKTDCGERNDRPVNTDGNTGEAALRAFDHIHNGAQNGANDNDRKQENSNLGPAFFERFDQAVSGSDKMDEF